MPDFVEKIAGAEVKKPLPLLFLPAVSLCGFTVADLIHDAGKRADAMAAVAARTDAAAAVGMMDLSLEAEAMGCKIRFSENEIPTVVAPAVAKAGDAFKLVCPPVGAGRCADAAKTVTLAKKIITDRPVLAGIIGPFSLAGRLMGVDRIMLACYDEPEAVSALLDLSSEFISGYLGLLKSSGADGAVMAEPLAGLLSPDLAAEFAEGFDRSVVASAKDDGFAVIYHNCGGSAPMMTDSLVRIGASGYHFGNVADMGDVLRKMPASTVCMGNISPSESFLSGTPDSMRAEVLSLCASAASHPNFLLSSGCDIPPAAPWENIDAFFAAAKEYSSDRTAQL